MAKVEIEFTLKNGDKVVTSNQAIIDQLKATGAAYTEVGAKAEETADKQVNANEEVAQSYQDILTEYKANVKELNALAIAGDTTSERFQELQGKVAKAKDALEDNSRALKANKSFGDALVGSISGVAGGFAAAQGLIGTFAGESEGLQKALLKVQSALAFAQGIEQLKDAKDSFSALGNSVKGPVVSAFNGLKGAIGATGIGLLVIGISLLIINFEKVKEAVLNFIPGLAKVGEVIGNLVDGLTDFIGLTSEAERQAGKLNTASQKNLKTSKDELEVLKARGATADVIYKKEREQAVNRVNDLNKIASLNKKLTKEELDERTQLIQDIKVLDAAETKRKEDEAKKSADEAAKKAKEEGEKVAAARKEARDKREAADAANAKRRVELIADETKRALAELDLQYQQELKAAKKNGEDTVLVKELYEKRKADLTKKIAEDSAKQQQDIVNLLNNLEEKATQVSINRKLELYNQDFDNYAKSEREKLKNASDTDKARLEEYLTLLRQKGESDLKYNDELKKIEKNSKLEQYKINEQYYKDVAAIQGNEALTFKEKKDAIALLDIKYAKAEIDLQIQTVEEKIRIAKLDPTNDPDKIKQLQDELLKLRAQGAAKQGEIDTAANENKAAKLILSHKDEIQATQQLLSELGSAIDDFYALAIEKQTASYDARLQANNDYYDELSNQNTEALNNELNDYSLSQEERANIQEQYALKEFDIRQKQAEETKRLEAEKAAELKKLKKQQARVDFAIQIAQIIGNTALSIAAAVAASPLTGGLPFSAINAAIGAIQVASAIAQLAQVESLAQGGILKGKSHAEGGIPIGNTGIEVEGGEAVINKRSTAMYTPLLSAINVAGGGRPLTPNFTGAMAVGGTIVVDNNSIVEAIQTGMGTGQITKAYILSSDVQSDIVKNNRIRRQASF